MMVKLNIRPEGEDYLDITRGLVFGTEIEKSDTDSK